MQLPWYKRFLSYFYPLRIETFPSEIQGDLELTLLNGKLVVDSQNANYSYGSLHRIFQKIIASLNVHEESKVLILGFGAGSIAKILNVENKLNCAIDGVEIDMQMITIYQNYFAINDDKITIYNEDAVDYLTNCTKQYDYVLIDLFIDIKVPNQIINKGFIDLIQSVCAKGNIVMNTMLPKNHEFIQVWRACFVETRLEEMDEANLVLFGRNR